jgi:ribulose-5-phosphate 4-epimerase/fuculose-1-phosphate aldolase
MGIAESPGRRPDHISAEEWALRQELAACYHLFDFNGWTESIFNHISLRVPGPERHFLMNPFGLNYNEVTASNLVKVDIHGRKVEPGPYDGNQAGFTIHGAVHEAREDAHCIIHTHTTAGQAVAGKEEGLRHDNFYGALLYGHVAYHDFEGITVRADERARLVASLGKKDVMILRNHGLLVLGRSVADAYQLYTRLQRACEVQVATTSMAGADRHLTPEIREQSAEGNRAFDPSGRLSQMVFEAAVRKMERARANRCVDFRE